MKGYCFLVLIIVVLITFQKEPLLTMIFVGGGIVLYMFYKSRRSGSGFLGGMLGGKASAQERNIDDLISLIMIQQLLSENSQPEYKTLDKKQEEKRAYLEKTSKEIAEILES